MWRESYEGDGCGERFRLSDTGWSEGHIQRAVSVRVLCMCDARSHFLGMCAETWAGSGCPPLREWHMQVSRRPPSATDEEWRTLYTFSEDEIFQRDIDAANYIMSMVDAAPFRDTVVCFKRFIMTGGDIIQAGYSMNDAEEKEILEMVERRKEAGWVRSWSLEGRKAVSRVGGKVVEEIVLESEEARVRVLREKMGLAMEDSDARWMTGRAAALP